MEILFVESTALKAVSHIFHYSNIFYNAGGVSSSEGLLTLPLTGGEQPMGQVETIDTGRRDSVGDGVAYDP